MRESPKSPFRPSPRAAPPRVRPAPSARGRAFPEGSYHERAVERTFGSCDPAGAGPAVRGQQAAQAPAGGPDQSRSLGPQTRCAQHAASHAGRAEAASAKTSDPHPRIERQREAAAPAAVLRGVLAGGMNMPLTRRLTRDRPWHGHCATCNATRRRGGLSDAKSSADKGGSSLSEILRRRYLCVPCCHACVSSRKIGTSCHLRPHVSRPRPIFREYLVLAGSTDDARTHIIPPRPGGAWPSALAS